MIKILKTKLKKNNLNQFSKNQNTLLGTGFGVKFLLLRNKYSFIILKLLMLQKLSMFLFQDTTIILQNQML